MSFQGPGKKKAREGKDRRGKRGMKKAARKKGWKKKEGDYRRKDRS